MTRERVWIASVVFSVVSTIIAIAGGDDVAADAGGNEQVSNRGILDILTVVATIVGAVLMYLPASDGYFRRR